MITMLISLLLFQGLVYAQDPILVAYHDSLVQYNESCFPSREIVMTVMRDNQPYDTLFSRPYHECYYHDQHSDGQSEPSYHTPDMSQIQFKYSDLSPNVERMETFVYFDQPPQVDQSFSIVSQTQNQEDANTIAQFRLRDPFNSTGKDSYENVIDLRRSITVQMDALNSTCVRSGLKGRLCEFVCETFLYGTYKRDSNICDVFLKLDALQIMVKKNSDGQWVAVMDDFWKSGVPKSFGVVKRHFERGNSYANSKPVRMVYDHVNALAEKEMPENYPAVYAVDHNDYRAKFRHLEIQVYDSQDPLMQLSQMIPYDDFKLPQVESQGRSGKKAFEETLEQISATSNKKTGWIIGLTVVCSCLLLSVVGFVIWYKRNLLPKIQYQKLQSFMLGEVFEPEV
ncbi:hypothetical protein MIR68_000479 [Amoeboaphelidium protococcarum]|nr:hypothetical protein MIR68_000479 [Amoeboaphelidium protococcarum]